MDITLLYFDDCPNWKIADERLAVITADRPDLTVSRHLVETLEEAERVGFHGSPSILVDGVDVFAEPNTGSSTHPTALQARLRWTSSEQRSAPETRLCDDRELRLDRDRCRHGRGLRGEQVRIAGLEGRDR
jgi:hypothetical protein